MGVENLHSLSIKNFAIEAAKMSLIALSYAMNWKRWSEPHHEKTLLQV